MPENASRSKSSRIVAGCMTGTSLDGLDVALVRIDGHGLQMKPTLIGHHAVSMPGDLRETLMHLASGNAAEPIVYLRAARQLGLFHAEGLGELFAKHPDAKPDFITAHGQTIWHAPKTDADLGPMSWQLFDPWPIFQRHGVPVCYDLRQADLIAGGEGAPLTPIADWVMYRSDDVKRIVMNLGGVCNATVLPSAGVDLAITAFDVGPCNLLIDGLVQKLYPGERYDVDGRISEQGGLWEDFSNHIVAAPFFKRAWPRTFGREDFNAAWIDGLIDYGRTGFNYGTMSDADMVASALYAVADGVITGFLRSTEGKPELILAGGGARNPGLIAPLRDLCEPYARAVLISDDLGIPCEAREAMGFAVLGALSQDGVPVSLPQVTGAVAPGVAGVWAGV